MMGLGEKKNYMVLTHHSHSSFNEREAEGALPNELHFAQRSMQTAEGLAPVLMPFNDLASVSLPLVPSCNSDHIF